MRLNQWLNRFFVFAIAMALLAGCGGGDGDQDATPIPDAPDETVADVIEIEEVCAPQCDGKDCGDDGCGDVCGTCEEGFTCNAAGKCEEDAVLKDQCLNEADGAVIAANPDAPLATTAACVTKLCLANPTIECVSDCVINGSDKTDPPIEGLPLSEECVACYAGSSLCGVENCLSECIADTTAPACGECLATHCLPAFYECSGLTPGCELPATWDSTGVVESLQVPADGVGCIDFDGDDQGDNGMAAAAEGINDIFADMALFGEFILFEFKGVTDFTDTAAFALNGVVGENGDGGYLLDPLSYDPDTCESLIHFADASIAGGALSAGPADFTVSFPVRDKMVQFALTGGVVQANVTGTIEGVEMADGILAGVLSKEHAKAVAATLEEICTADPAIDWCVYVPVIKAAIETDVIFDLDTDEDGTNDAVSLCLQFTGSAAKIAGFEE